MNWASLFFYVFALTAIVCSLLVVFKKSPIVSAANLVFVFFSFAAIYAILGAHLIAAMQVLVYAGAIIVLFVFVIMLLNADVPFFDFKKSNLGLRIAASLFTVITIGVFVYKIRAAKFTGPQSTFTIENIQSAGGNTRVISELMFNQYILPFELTSLLLLTAIVGTVAMAKRSARKKTPSVAMKGAKSES